MDSSRGSAAAPQQIGSANGAQVPRAGRQHSRLPRAPDDRCRQAALPSLLMTDPDVTVCI